MRGEVKFVVQFVGNETYLLYMFIIYQRMHK